MIDAMIEEAKLAHECGRAVARVSNGGTRVFWLRRELNQFVLVSFGTDKKLTQHVLDRANTSAERLAAHWVGFVQSFGIMIP